MKCVHCGAQVKQDTNYCSQCGMPVATALQAPSKTVPILVGAFVSVSLLLAGFVSIWVLGYGEEVFGKVGQGAFGFGPYLSESPDGDGLEYQLVFEDGSSPDQYSTVYVNDERLSEEQKRRLERSVIAQVGSNQNNNGSQKEGEKQKGQESDKQEQPVKNEEPTGKEQKPTQDDTPTQTEEQQPADNEEQVAPSEQSPKDDEQKPTEEKQKPDKDEEQKPDKDEEQKPDKDEEQKPDKDEEQKPDKDEEQKPDKDEEQKTDDSDEGLSDKEGDTQEAEESKDEEENEATGDAGPKEDDKKESDKDAAAKGKSNSEYVLPESDTRTYSEKELKELTDWELFVARNEIYARHGRGFENKDLQAHFNSCKWYKRLYEPKDFDASMLSDVEKKNAIVIQKVEEQRKSPYLN